MEARSCDPTKRLKKLIIVEMGMVNGMVVMGEKNNVFFMVGRVIAVFRGGFSMSVSACHCHPNARTTIQGQSTILANIYPGNDSNHIIFVVYEGKWGEPAFGECNAIMRLSQPFTPLSSRRVDKLSWRWTRFERFNSAINVLWILPLRKIRTCLEAVKHWVMLSFWGWGEFQRGEFSIGDISLILPLSSIGSS